MKRKGNRWTAWVVLSALICSVFMALTVVFAVADDWVWFFVMLGLTVGGGVFLGIMLERHSAYAMKLWEHKMLCEFLEFARANYKAQGIETDKEPFEEFLARDCAGGEKNGKGCQE